MPACRECAAQFTIHPNDQRILDYFDAPPPSLCAMHSLQNRLAWRNERHLYRRVCELCRKDILAMQSLESYAHVYCRECWYSDNWDAATYGHDWDPSRSFLEQWYDLVRAVPQFNVWQHGENSNCEYTNYIFSNKDCYLSFSIVRSEGLLYCKTTDDSRDCTDCLGVIQSELLYDCVTTRESYASAYLTRCQKCSACYLCRDLTDCQNCFGCVNLKHKQYYWFNELLRKDEYERRLAAALHNREAFEEREKQFHDFAASFPVESATIVNSEDVSGNEIINAKSIRASFFIKNCENLGECYRLLDGRNDSYRNSYGGLSGGTVYESTTTPRVAYTIASFTVGESTNVAYSANIFSCDDLLGCVSLRKKQYCILNKQYSKEAYESLRTTIIADMKQRGEWGEFLPVRYAPVGYNDSVAYEFFPCTREDAQSQQLPWVDDQGGSSGKETIEPSAVPDNAGQTDDSINKHILRCVHCSMNYRVIKKELAHCVQLGLSVPLTCPDCRFKKRMQRFFIPILYNRHCMCTENHSFHSDGPCSQEFETTYRPDGIDMIYCKPCYRELI